LGLILQISGWYFPTQWQDAIAFTILIIFLLIRPQGFLGKPVRSATV
jgi:branched-subunit amino acid ABC-type transport system permease component